MFVIIFPNYRDIHLHKDVIEFGMALSAHLDVKTGIFVSEHEGVDYSALRSRGLRVFFITPRTGSVTIDLMLTLAKNIRSFDVVQAFHMCRFTFFTLIGIKAWSALLRHPLVTVVKADHNGQVPNIFKSTFYRLFRPICNTIDLATTETIATYDYYQKLRVFRNVVHVPNGIFMMYSNADPHLVEKDDAVIYAGRVSEFQKNTPEFLNACPIFLNRHPEWVINIYGYVDDALGAVFSGFFECFPSLRTKIHLHGHVDRLSLEKAFARSKLLVLTSRWEGSPAVLNEAQYWGVRVVSTEFPSAREMCVEPGSLRTYPSGNVAALAERMSEVVSNDNYYKSGRYLEDRVSFSSSLSWSAVTRKPAACISEIIISRKK